MNLSGDIIIIEDDVEDRDILLEIFQDVLDKNNYANRIVFLADSTRAMDYLKSEEASPFLIVSDINMPMLDGFALRKKIFDDPDLNDKCVPYIFLTTSGDNTDFMKRAYGLSVQGYFTKPNDYQAYFNLINDIIRYWKVAKIANRAQEQVYVKNQ